MFWFISMRRDGGKKYWEEGSDHTWQEQEGGGQKTGFHLGFFQAAGHHPPPPFPGVLGQEPSCPSPALSPLPEMY